jgi:hypothetical protein
VKRTPMVPAWRRRPIRPKPWSGAIGIHGTLWMVRVAINLQNALEGDFYWVHFGQIAGRIGRRLDAAGH